MANDRKGSQAKRQARHAEIDKLHAFRTPGLFVSSYICVQKLNKTSKESHGHVQARKGRVQGNVSVFFTTHLPPRALPSLTEASRHKTTQQDKTTTPPQRQET